MTLDGAEDGADDDTYEVPTAPLLLPPPPEGDAGEAELKPGATLGIPSTLLWLDGMAAPVATALGVVQTSEVRIGRA